MPLALAGCRAPERGAGQPVVIRSSHWGMVQDARMWQDLARTFNARQSRIHVKLEHIVGQNYHAKMIAMRVGNCAPDVVAADDEQFRQLASAGVYEDLGPFLAGDKTLNRDLLLSSGLGQFRHGWQAVRNPLPRHVSAALL